MGAIRCSSESRPAHITRCRPSGGHGVDHGSPEGDPPTAHRPPPAQATASGPGPARPPPTARRPAPRPCRAPAPAAREVQPAGRAGELDGQDAIQVGDGRRSLRAAPHPIDTWSSCIATGRDGVDGGRRGQAAVLGHHRGLRCSGRSSGRSPPPSGARNGAGRGWVRSSSRSVRRSTMAPTSATAMARKSTRRPVVRRGSSRRTPPGRPAGSWGCRWPTPARNRPPGRRGRRCRGPLVHLRGATQRVGVLHPGSPSRWLATIAEPARSRRRLAALAAWPGWGRRAWRSAAKARSVPSRASTDMAPVMSAACSSRRRSARASTSRPRIPSVPLISASPSFARSVTGLRPAAASASGADRTAPLASRSSPSPMRASAASASGARSPLSAQRAVLVDHRREPGVEHGDQALRHFRASTRAAHGQAPGPQQHHGANHLTLDHGAHARGVRADQRQLQFGRALGWDRGRGQRAEAGGDAVDGLVGGEEAVDQLGAGVHRGASRCRQHDLLVVARHRHDISGAQTALGDLHHGRQCSDRLFVALLRFASAGSLLASLGNASGRVAVCRPSRTHRAWHLRRASAGSYSLRSAIRQVSLRSAGQPDVPSPDRRPFGVWRCRGSACVDDLRVQRGNSDTSVPGSPVLKASARAWCAGARRRVRRRELQ